MQWQYSFSMARHYCFENDYELTNSDMVYKLATPTQISDLSWIKPGKVAWDWWNDWNLYNVNFKTGVNNPTYNIILILRQNMALNM